MPALAAMREALAASGAIMARMTGSGSALFGVFADAGCAGDAARVVGVMKGVAAAIVVPTLTGTSAAQRTLADV